MGRRKIEIKAIKDDRNRSVTFLKRKGGLFKKAHELSVLCSVDVAVFIFGNNKKLYEYSSTDMRDLIGRYQYHGGPNEHKGPIDFNGGNDDDDDEEGDITPPRGMPDQQDHQMMQRHYHGQQPFAPMRHHTQSASPPVPNGGPFHGHHPGHPAGPHGPRGGTPQPPMGSRPGSRNDMRRHGPGPPGQAHGGPHPGITYMPTPPIYNPQPSQPGPPAQHSQYSYPPHHHQQPPPHHEQHHHQQQQQPPPPLPPHSQGPRHYPEDRRPSAPPGYTPHPPPPQPGPALTRTEPSPPHHGVGQQHPPPPVPRISPPPQSHSEHRLQEPQPAPPVEIKSEHSGRQPPLLNTDSAVKKMPPRKSHSIFTPIEENRSILSQHLASFSGESPGPRPEAGAGQNRSLSLDATVARGGSSTSPPHKRVPLPTGPDKNRAASVSTGPEPTFAPPQRSNSLKLGGAGPPSRPRLTVQIPDGASEPGSAGAESNSPHNPSITPTQGPRHNSVVLPPPSPSASALLSAGATGPPNPFARPPPQQGVNGETPVSALPSRFLNNELLPSPSSFYPEWNYRSNDSNTLPSPLNFATPVVGSGPSFLRDDAHGTGSSHPPTSNTTTTAGAATSGPTATKRKSTEFSTDSQGSREGTAEAKRLKV